MFPSLFIVTRTERYARSESSQAWGRIVLGPKNTKSPKGLGAESSGYPADDINGKGTQAPKTSQTEKERKHKGQHKRKRNTSTMDVTNGKETQVPRTTQTEKKHKHQGRHKGKWNASTKDNINGKGTQAPRMTQTEKERKHQG